MSQPTSRHAFLALFGLLAAIAGALPAPAAAAEAALAQKPPSIMRLASDGLARPTAMPAAATSTYPAVPALNAAPAASRPNREVLGFAQAGGLGSGSGSGWNTWNYSLLSTVAYFGVHIAGDGTIVKGDYGYSTWQSADVTNMIGAAHSAGARVVLTLVCQDYTGSACGSGGYCAALQNQSTTISQAIAEVQGRGVDGINVDYEGSAQTCPNGQTTRTLLRTLVQGLRAARPSMNLTVDTYASSASDSTGPIDVPGLAASVNGFFVMAYELDNSNWSQSPLSCTRYCFSPTSPHSGYAWTDDRVAREYTAAAGAGKTILGLPYYGYAACVQSTSENAYPQPSGSSPAPQWSVPTEVGVQGLSSSVSGYSEHRDSHNGVDRWATYYSSSFGCNREMYLDDAYSIGRKYDQVNAYGLGGTGMWSLDYGGGLADLWNAVASHFTLQPTAPAWVAACAGAASAYVSWAPSASGGGPVTQYTVTAAPGGATVTTPGSATAVQFTGLTPGTAYTFTVQAQNGYGAGPVSNASNAVTAAASATTSYFTWFDRASPGMNNDNIHLVNPGPGDDAGCVYVSGVAVSAFSIHAGSTTYLGFPGSIGGPVAVVTTQGRTLAAQRVQYNQSFNEVPASATAQNTLYFPWYDHASPGMTADNIHVINPGASAATVQISGPGPTITLNVPAGGEGVASWPAGTIGGPVKISSPSVPVIASQRVQYYSTFNETLAHGLQDASQALVFNWYDTASPGMWNVNVHLVNPQSADAVAQVNVGSATQRVTVPAGGTAIVSFPSTIGGPLTVNATGKILASQRVQYYTSFNEAAATPLSSGVAAPTSIWMPWYDDASPGMVGDNVHVVNVDPANTAHVTITGPGSARTFDLGPGLETYTSWPGAIGGPVNVSSTGAPVVASQRVQFYQTFNEAIGLVG